MCRQRLPLDDKNLASRCRSRITFWNRTKAACSRRRQTHPRVSRDSAGSYRQAQCHAYATRGRLRATILSATLHPLSPSEILSLSSVSFSRVRLCEMWGGRVDLSTTVTRWGMCTGEGNHGTSDFAFTHDDLVSAQAP